MKYSLHIIVSRNFLFAQNGSNFIILHYRIIAGLLDLSTNLNNRSLYHSLRFDETNPEHAARTGVPKGRSGPRSGSGSPRLASRRKSRFPQLSPAVRGDPPFTRPIVRGAPTLRLWMSGTRGTQLHALRPGHVRVREVASTREKEREGGGRAERERNREGEAAQVRAIIGDSITSCRVVFPVDSLPPHAPSPSFRDDMLSIGRYRETGAPSRVVRLRGCVPRRNDIASIKYTWIRFVEIIITKPYNDEENNFLARNMYLRVYSN